jgi:cytochrome P450
LASKAVEAWRRPIERTVEELLDGLPASGELDVMEAFARPVPLRTIAGVLSLPVEDLGRLTEWSEAIAFVLEPMASVGARRRADRAIDEMGVYLRDRIARRRADPGDDLLSYLVSAEETGRMSQDELVAMLVLLFVAGHETTTNLLGNGTLALARHPHQAEAIRRDPSLVRSAVEEMLRYEPSTLLNIRLTKEAIELRGTEIPAGHAIYCVLGAANRDPEVFPDPDRFDVARFPNPHVSFGGGVHYCLGAPLARLQAQIAFPAILSRWEHMELASEDVRWRPTVNIRGLERLAVRVRA